MKWRMHKRTETKPDGRKIYYYTFEPLPVDTADNPPPAPPEPTEAISAPPDGCIPATERAR